MPKPLGERVKIAATIGPASSDPAILARLLEEGVDAIRINASHARPAEIPALVELVRSVGRSVSRDVAVIHDLQGIKRRIGPLEKPLLLKEGETVVLSARGGADRIPVDVRPFQGHLARGASIFLDDGFLHLHVKRIAKDEIVCEVVIGGFLKSRAGLNLPGIAMPARIPTKYDLEHVAVGVAAGVDVFALSFVRSAADLWRCRKHTAGIPIIAKIERPEAVAAIDEIAAASDGILIARGDLAVEMKPEMLPVLQKSLVRSANRARKPVIVATEMLASMVYNPRPTRAELTDVGNAVLDGADATLLSNETAVGRDPVRAVRYMARIVGTVESSLGTYNLDLPRSRADDLTRPDWAVADAAVEMAAKVEAKALIAVTGSGRTARLMSAGRPSVPLYSFSPDPSVRRRVAIMWGVNAEAVEPIPDPDKLIAHILKRLRTDGRLRREDRAVFVYGSPLWAEGTKTNAIRIATA